MGSRAISHGDGSPRPLSQHGRGTGQGRSHSNNTYIAASRRSLTVVEDDDMYGGGDDIPMDEFRNGVAKEPEWTLLRDTPDGYPPLDFKPFQLETVFLLCVCIFFAGCVAAIFLLRHFDIKQGGLFHFHGKYNYMAIHYVPSAVGSLTTILWGSMNSTLGRMQPYISMAQARQQGSKHSGRACRTIGAAYIAPLDIFHAMFNRHRMLAFMFVNVWLTRFFMVPLKTTFFIIAIEDGRYVVHVPQAIAYLLVALYTSLFASAFWMLIVLRSISFGLQHDPVSIADQLLLFGGSNALKDLASLEMKDRRQAWRQLVACPQNYQIGYWQCGEEIWYGIRSFNVKPQEFSLSSTSTQQPPATTSHVRQVINAESGQAADHIVAADAIGEANSPHRVEHPAPSSSDAPQPSLHHSDGTSTPVASGPDVEEAEAGVQIVQQGTHLQKTKSQYTMEELRKMRYRVRPSVFWLIPTTTFIILALVLIVLGFLALLYYRFQDGRHFVSGYWSETLKAFHPYNVAFRTVVGITVSFFSMPWTTGDFWYRMVQPFANMCKPQPATENILLEYPAAPPVLITFNALKAGHYKVALMSFLHVTTVIVVSLAGSIFSVIPDKDGKGTTVLADATTGYIVIICLIIWLLSLLVLYPTQKRALPRGAWSLADLMSFCHASRIMKDEAIITKGLTDKRIHMLSRLHLQKAEYAFGIYYGVDGRQHMGFDVFERAVTDGVGPMTLLKPRPSIWYRFWRAVKGKPKQE